MRANTVLFGLLGSATLAFATVSTAQEQPATTAEPAAVIPAPATTVPAPAPASVTTSSPSSGSTERPSRGSTMDNVRAKFGAPSQEDQAVGTPPITRWEYPGYVVYFENDRVLHTVVAR